MSIAFRREFRAVLRLALPLAAAQVGQMLLGLVDTAVVGRLGASELAAVGVGNSIFFTLAIFGTGLVLGVEPTIAQAVGAGRIKRARGLVTQGQWLGLILSLPLAASCLGLSAVARRWG
ncbi:MAG: MATE family efflux transporter, partial [Myxococcota bacterium]